MKIQVSTIISAPIDTVFDLFTDLDKVQSRIPAIKKIEILDGPAKMQKGTKWKETREMFGKESTETMTVSDIVPNQMFRAKAASHGSKYTSTYRFKTENEKTVVALEFLAEPISIVAKLFTPLGYLFKKSLVKAFQKDFDEFKKSAESL